MMRKALISAVCLLAAACGSNTEQRSSTGALTGIGIGALAGGPIGALIGGVAGGAGGAMAPEGADQAARQAIGWEKREVASTTGIGEGSSQPPASTANLTVPKDTVRQIQQELRAQNDYSGPIDGVMGPETRRAIRQYQQQNGLNATGELDTATLQRLTAAAENSSDRNTGSGSSAPAENGSPTPQ